MRIPAHRTSLGSISRLVPALINHTVAFDSVGGSSSSSDRSITSKRTFCSAVARGYGLKLTAEKAAAEPTKRETRASFILVVYWLFSSRGWGCSQKGAAAKRHRDRAAQRVQQHVTRKCRVPENQSRRFLQSIHESSVSFSYSCFIVFPFSSPGLSVPAPRSKN